MYSIPETVIEWHRRRSEWSSAGEMALWRPRIHRQRVCKPSKAARWDTKGPGQVGVWECRTSMILLYISIG